MISYNHTASLLFKAYNGLKLALLSNDAIIDLNHTIFPQVVGGGERPWEVISSGLWITGGRPLTGITLTVFDVNKGRLAADDLMLTPTATIGPFRYALITLTDGTPICYEKFPENRYLAQGHIGGFILSNLITIGVCS